MISPIFERLDGTDDPPLFHPTLNQEIGLLATSFGLDSATIGEILLNGVRCSFLPAERCQELEQNFRSEMATLKRRYTIS